MTDKLYTQTEGGIRYWTREELLIRAETAEAEVERAEAQAHEFESEAIHNGEIMQSLAAEVAALKVRIAEMEAGAQWRPASEPPAEHVPVYVAFVEVDDDDEECYEVTEATYCDGVWRGLFSNKIRNVAYWLPIQPLPDPPTEPPAE